MGRVMVRFCGRNSSFTKKELAGLKTLNRATCHWPPPSASALVSPPPTDVGCLYSNDYIVPEHGSWCERDFAQGARARGAAQILS